ncbi:LamG-like jellyroll fold domain-containing protein [Chondrinema litorale]|uniref:LamG-like jellyroll fold domain-containing protein n=1 Tax=Chondrinema litorale TaxID=2994555 RepID=UPI0025438786|nr:LamG-like jellyroll fold domain-containing protein [Chondrinema litorale]UZR97237.1 T9SS type A sorting domain-containing protein [Chondrinema litorale]
MELKNYHGHIYIPNKKITFLLCLVSLFFSQISFAQWSNMTVHHDEGYFGTSQWDMNFYQADFNLYYKAMLLDEDDGGCGSDDWLRWNSIELAGDDRLFVLLHGDYSKAGTQIVWDHDNCGQHDYYIYNYKGEADLKYNGFEKTVSNDDLYVGIRFYIRPEWLGKSITFYVGAEGDGLGVPNPKPSKTISFPALPIPGSLTATPGCGEIDLSWDDPSDLKGYGSNYQYIIYEDGSLIATVSGTTKTYKRTTTGTHTYKVAIRYTEGGRVYESSTVSAQGNTIESLGAPAGLTASVDRCDGSVKLEWQWSFSNPKEFWLKRSTTENGTYSKIATVSKSKRTYTDTGLTRGATYYYKISAVSDDCDKEGDESDFVSGISPADPTAPSNFKMELITGANSGVRLTWTKGAYAEGYRIVRRGINGGEKEFTIEDPDDITFTDQDAKSCEAYEYELFAYNVCKEVTAGKAKLVSDASKDVINITDVDISQVLDSDRLEASKGYFGNRVVLQWTSGDNASFVNRYKIYRRELGSAVVPEFMEAVTGEERNWIDDVTKARQLYEYFIIAENECGLETQLTFDVNLLDGRDYSNLNLPANGVGYDVGFRLPVAFVNGNIVYEGGVAVPDVKVIAERQDGVSGNALFFDGVNDYAQIGGAGFSNLAKDFTLSMWVRPETVSGEQVLIYKHNSYTLLLNNDKVKVGVYKSGNFEYVQSDTALTAGDYVNITVTHDTSDSLKIYINGLVAASQKIAVGGIANTVNNIYLGRNEGGTSYFNGYIDEVRIYKNTLDSDQVIRDYGRIVNPDEDGLQAYWRFDEGVGPFIFDASEESGVYHQNDGNLFGATWSDEIPTGSQLANASYTDEAGNYSITGIIYEGSGENFTISPTMTLGGAIHSFDPSKQIVFLGEGSSVENGVDFKDISSFRVTGNVYFTHLSKNGEQEVGSKGISIYIDGEIAAVKDGNLVTTDDYGAFDIQVPIGRHFLEFKKLNHTIQNTGRFPLDKDTWDFQEPVSGIIMLDSTTKVLIGRAVGGPVERDKILGFGKSTNNIGVVKFTLESANDGGLVSETVFTNDTSGEYSVALPPKEYKVTDVKYKKDDSFVFTDAVGAPLAQENVDMSTLVFDTESLDSVYVTDQDTTIYINSDNTVLLDTTGITDDLVMMEIDRPDTVIAFNNTTNVFDTTVVTVTDSFMVIYKAKEVLDTVNAYVYHFKRNFILRNKPVIIVTDQYGRDFTKYGGDSLLVMKDASDKNYYADLSTLNYRVFQQGSSYKMNIFLFEQYKNIDSNKGFNVPVTDAELTINNSLGTGFYLETSGDQEQAYLYSNSGADIIKMDSWDTLYHFKAGTPNLLANASKPEESYLKTFTIQAKAGTNIIEWPELGAGGQPNPFKGYVLGGLQIGNNFVTKGPDNVDFVLRDPPFDGSYSYISKGSTFTSTKEVSNDFDGSVGLTLKTTAGLELYKGLGVITKSTANVTTAGTLGLNVSGGFGSENVYSYETNTSFQTRDDPTLVGAPSDLFVGSSTNLLFGIVKNLSLVDEADCALSNVECPVDLTVTAKDKDGNIKTMKLARYKQLAFGQGGINTTFVYDQNHIENYLIPNLKALRDNLLTGNSKYVNKVNATNYSGKDEDWIAEHLGTDNDDIVWGTLAVSNDLSPTGPDGIYYPNTGPSYTFTPTRKGEIDSLRWFNQQLKMWTNTLADNEIAKWLAIEGFSSKSENISISGQSEYTYEYTAEWEDTDFKNFSIGPFAEVGTESKLSESGSGATIDYNIKFSYTNTTSSSTSNGDSFTIGYSINDDDVGDSETINIYGTNEDPYSAFNKNSYKNTPIFQTLAGQTACPHEDEVTMKFTSKEYVGEILVNIQNEIDNLTEDIDDLEVAIDAATGVVSTISAGSAIYIPGAGLPIAAVVGGVGGSEIEKMKADLRKLEARKEKLEKKQTLLTDLKAKLGGTTDVTLSNRTLQRDKPGLYINGSQKEAELYNIPADESASFYLTFANESETDDNQYYILEVIESTNPDGLVLKIDGVAILANRSYLVPGGQSLSKSLTIERGPFEFNYENVQLVLHSACQYDLTDNDVDVDDTVSVSAYFLPSCSEPVIFQPQDNWTVNNSLVDDNDTTRILYQIGGFNINYPNFRAVELQYKSSGESDDAWVLLETYYRDSTDRAALGGKEEDPIIARDGDGSIKYIWKQVGSKTLNGGYVWSVPDGDYDLRAVTICGELGNLTRVYSSIHSGTIDRETPHAFGAPQPSDGVLSPGDEILIQFNEPINAGLLRPANFDIRGVLNGADIRHPASVYFDGVETNYMEIPEGISLARRSFTIDFYAKRKNSGKEILFSQGFNSEEGLTIGFNNSNELEISLANQVITSAKSISDEYWHHYAVTFDVEESTGAIYIDGQLEATDNSYSPDYKSTGKILVGKQKFDAANPFKGNIHELRIWRKALSLSEVNIYATKRLSGNEPGLTGNWRMEEAYGTIAEDLARDRHATVKATWQVEPNGHSVDFNGSDAFVKTKSPAVTDEMNFTLEFWFKGSNVINATLISNGRGDTLKDVSGDLIDANRNGWSVNANANGYFEVWNNGTVFQATNESYFDGEWHHFALIVNRRTNTVCAIDGEQKNTITSEDFNGFGGAGLWIGSRGWVDLTGAEQHDKFFTGKIDELKVWQIARPITQIKRDMHYMLNGDEPGLQLYHPFDRYKEMAGLQVLDPTFISSTADGTGTAIVDTASVGGSAIHSEITPTVKLPRPVSKINFNYSANGDKIILTTNDPDSLLENVILDITVKNVEDLNANVLSSPVTWSAFVDKNQVTWEEEALYYTIEEGDGLTFETKIKNAGGKFANFEIKNLPTWLSASPSSGTISPVSTERIVFTVDPNINIGSYSQDLQLVTEFGFEEVMVLDLKVYKPLPEDWEITETDYQFSMNVIAQLSINGEISRDPDDKVAAFVGNECRGIADLIYVPAYDNYQAFINVYSNSTTGEQVNFRIWNASDGQVHRDVTPNFVFSPNAIYGSPSSPELLKAEDVIEASTTLPKGWKWVSYYLAANSLKSTDELLKEVKAENGDLIKGIDKVDSYDKEEGWKGTLTLSGGIENGKAYKLYLSYANEFKYKGRLLRGEEVTININKDWNWVGYVGFKNMAINQALSSFTNATTGDLIKSQYAVAIYVESIGWVGNLTYLHPGEGYMMKAAKSGSITFPNQSFSAGERETTGFLSGVDSRGRVTDSNWDVNWAKYKYNMNAVIEVENLPDELESEKSRLAAVVNGEYRGVAYPVYNPLLEKDVYFMTIYSNSNFDEKIEFEFFNGNDGLIHEVIGDFKFTNDNLEGTMTDPVLLQIGDEHHPVNTIVEKLEFTAYPNPFEKNLDIDIYSPEAGSVTVTLVDVNGKEVHKEAIDDLQVGSNHYNIKTKGLANGIYIIRIEKEDGESLYQKILKK